MSSHMQKEIDGLKRHVLRLGAVVEEALTKAVDSVERRDARLAAEVIERDTDIDRLEVEIEEECLKVLALHQPVAVDLRLIVSMLKINNDLERIGDLAVNVAERAQALADEPVVGLRTDLRRMAERARYMLKSSLDSLVNLDPSLAQEVRESDDEVDEINRQMFAEFEIGVGQAPQMVKAYLQLLSVSRHIERIADYATNIAEDVIYMVEGEIVRHPGS